MSNTMIQSGHGMLLNRGQWSDFFRIQLFQKTLSKEKQKAHKPRLQGNMGIFETSLQ